jgi:hypothetical protein
MNAWSMQDSMKIAQPWWGEAPEKSTGFHGAYWFSKNLKGLLG